MSNGFAPVMLPVFGNAAVPAVCGFGLDLKLDGFRLVYCLVAVLMWTVSGIFSREYMAHYANRRRYYIFFWATFAATVGVFLSANLYTTFIFFEIMSFTSYVWVVFDERRETLKAAETYLAVAVIGGMVMLMGLFLLYDLFGTLDMEELGYLAQAVCANPAQAAVSVSADGPTAVWVASKVSDGSVFAGIFPSQKAQLYTAGALLLFGFGAKAGCFPLHIWLPKAHPEAPAPASALLSGILTKTGVFGVIVVSCVMFGADHSWGLLIVALGLVTMFLGAFLALFSVNLKRTLACSSISQIGFILTGIGMACLLRSVGEGNTLAVRGAFLHMVNHSLFKLVLFLCAGVVYMNLHKLDLNDIRGFGRGKTALMYCFLMGAIGIGGVPLWNGYVSKTLIHESIVEYMEFVGGPLVWHVAEWVFLFTGGMTVAYMLKLSVALFVEKNRDEKRQAEFDAIGNGAGSGRSGAHPYMNRASSAVLVAAATILPVLGLTPHLTMDRIADLGQSFFQVQGHAHEVAYFSLGNLKGGLISIAIGVLLYAVVVRGFLMEPDGAAGRRYVDRWPAWLDLENLLYRPVLQVMLPAICGTVFEVIDKYLISSFVAAFQSVGTLVSRTLDSLTDGLIRLARATTHSQIREEKEALATNLMAHMIGGALDRAADIRDGLPWRRYRRSVTGDTPEKRKSAVPRMVRREEQLKHLNLLIQGSFSYGLMLVCIGMVLTLGYLLAEFFGIL